MARTPAEARLLASLETLEKGGDALQDAPHDGGLATEGTNIQSSAKAMKKALRGLMKGGMSRRKAEETLKALYAKSDDASSDDDVAKAGNDDDDSMSSDDDSGDGESAGGGDDESDEGGESSSDQPAKGGKPFGKSHGASQLANLRPRQRSVVMRAFERLSSTRLQTQKLRLMLRQSSISSSNRLTT